MTAMAALQFRQLFDGDSPFRALFDAMSALVFIVDDRLVVHDANLAAARALGPDAELVLKRLCGDVLRCLNSGVDPKAGEAGPCGDTVHCSECVLRKSTAEALAGEPTTRRPYAMRLLVGSAHREAHFVVNATPFEYGGQRYAMLVLEDITDLQTALAEVRTLKGILPICCGCKKIRNDKNYWEQVEVYVMKHTDAKFSHGYCPECVEKYYPGCSKEKA
jgi:PAS domain-containing protein